MPGITSTLKRNKVVTLGEVMMRLTTPGQARFAQSEKFKVIYAGAEANVAAALAHWGIHTSHITAFPHNDLGKSASQYLREFGVDIDYIKFAEGRLGVYFIESGNTVRAPKVIYDRFNSCFANITPTDFNWEEILNDAVWFHWSGITPAISQSAAMVCLRALKVARSKGVIISGDINYRRNLWQYGKAAHEIMPELIRYTDVVVGGIGDFKNCVGISSHDFESTCEKVVQQFKDIRLITTTHRDVVSASHNKISALLWNGKRLYESKTYDLMPIVDRIGTGDAYMAGFIYSKLQGDPDELALEFAIASCALKHTVEGDVNVVSTDEIAALVKGDNVGKLLR